MTDTPPKPKRRRWRWPVAGVFLFLAGIRGWWYWPRHDAKFVGRWAISDPRLIGEVIELHANGRCEQYYVGGINSEGYRRWWAEGDEIVLDRWPTDLPQIARSLPELLWKVAGRGDPEKYLRLKVSNLSRDEFSFHLNEFSTRQQTALRLPE